MPLLVDNFGPNRHTIRSTAAAAATKNYIKLKLNRIMSFIRTVFFDFLILDSFYDPDPGLRKFDQLEHFMNATTLLRKEERKEF